MDSFGIINATNVKFSSCFSAGTGGTFSGTYTTSYWDRCYFLNSSSISNGGTLHCDERCGIFIKDSTISYSQAYHGGAFYAYANSIVSAQNTIATYNGAQSGSVAYVAADSKLNFTGCTFDENISEDGTITSTYSSKIYLTNTSLVDNFAKNHGGALSCADTKVWIKNCSTTLKLNSFALLRPIQHTVPYIVMLLGHLFAQSDLRRYFYDNSHWKG